MVNKEVRAMLSNTMGINGEEGRIVINNTMGVNRRNDLLVP